MALLAFQKPDKVLMLEADSRFGKMCIRDSVLSVSLNRIRVRVLSLLAKKFVESLVNQLVLNNHLN